MGILGSLAKWSAMGTGGAIGAGAIGVAGAHAATGPLAAAAIGSTVGGVYGFAASDSNTMTGRIGQGISGAMYGGVLGAGAGLAGVITPAVSQRVAGALTRYANNPQAVEGTLANALPGAMKLGEDLGAASWNYGARPVGRAAAWMGLHPGTTLLGLGVVGGIGAAAAYDEGQINYSPTLAGERVDRSYKLQQQAVQEMSQGGIQPSGSVGTYMQRMGGRQNRLASSTTGLVQGMHRGRHGGY